MEVYLFPVSLEYGCVLSLSEGCAVHGPSTRRVGRSTPKILPGPGRRVVPCVRHTECPRGDSGSHQGISGPLSPLDRECRGSTPLTPRCFTLHLLDFHEESRNVGSGARSLRKTKTEGLSPCVSSCPARTVVPNRSERPLYCTSGSVPRSGSQGVSPDSW